MGRIRGLVWDDDPEDFMVDLQTTMEIQGVELAIREYEQDFIQLMTQGSWDFVIIDLLDGRTNSTRGVDLARTVANIKKSDISYPIFLLTHDPGRMTKELYGMLPMNAVVRGKNDLFWTAQFIREELERRGVYVDRKRVFSIRSQNNPLIKRTIVQHFDEQLDVYGLEMVTIQPGDLPSLILDGLVRKMNECGAILAICTADDLQASGDYFPRLDVLLEMGIALGLNRGSERLIVLQQWGATKDTQAVLPSDLGGVLTIRFKDRPSEAFSDLESRLRAIRMEMK